MPEIDLPPLMPAYAVQRALHRNALPAHRFKTRQRSHFAVCVVLPTLLMLLVPLALPSPLPNGWLSLEAIGLWAVMWFLVGGVGVSVGLHRHFSHRAFAARPFLRGVMAAFGCMAGQGTVCYWVALHRSHHTHSDQPGDSHSPIPSAHGLSSRWAAFVQGHIGWVWRHDVPSPTRYAADLIRDPLIVRVDRLYNWIVLSGIALPGFVGVAIWGGWSGFLVGAYWGGIVRIAVGHHIIWAINSVCHFAGHRPHETGDRSANVWWLGVLSFGESWHNNHHQAPTSASFKHHWWQLDIGWTSIQLAGRLGWASNIKEHEAQSSCENQQPVLSPEATKAFDVVNLTCE